MQGLLAAIELKAGMLKLSALQPHLTAADALNQRAAWVQGGRYVQEGLAVQLQLDSTAQFSTWQQLTDLNTESVCLYRASKDSSHSGITNRHARTQDWHAQGQELTGSHQPKRQLSVCIQLEVKLAEALDKCDSLCPPQADDHGQLRPNKLRTAVCCKVRQPDWFSHSVRCKASRGEVVSSCQ